jgi:cyclohexa-1,5-dienecarbonyl-CoA hydratase
VTASFRFDRAGAIGELVFTKAPANVLAIGDLEALTVAVRHLAAEPPAVLLVHGERHFCAGVDIADHAPAKVDAMLGAMHGFVDALLATPTVTIAAVEGACLGGGAEILLACDLAYAGADARIGFPEITLACFPPTGAILLPSAIGPSRAAELLFSGEAISGRAAQACGLVAQACASEDLLGEARRKAAAIASRAPAARDALREALRAPRREAFRAGRGTVEAAYREVALRPELAGAVAAFLSRT